MPGIDDHLGRCTEGLFYLFVREAGGLHLDVPCALSLGPLQVGFHLGCRE